MPATTRVRRGPEAVGLVLALTLAVMPSGGRAAADRFADVEIEALPAGGGVYMLRGAGGNVGILPGPDGVVMVDDQYAPLAPELRAAIASLGGGEPTFLINTHFHGDHVGGNPAFASTATILAHENVRVRLLRDDDFDPAGLPVVTFDDGIRLFLNGERIDVRHLPNGHTDGDAIVWFRNAGVVHLGDHLFTGRFPFVDLAHGGSVRGMLENLRHVLETVPDDVRLIAGHGPMADVDDLREFADMLDDSLQWASAALARGESEAAIRERGLPKRLARWSWELVDEDRWLRTLLTELRGADGSRG